MTTPSPATGFTPFEGLALALLPHAVSGDDGSHDTAHLLRVWKNARLIAATEGGETEDLAAAVLLHDCVAVEKNAPHRASASRLAADKAGGLLAGLNWSAQRIDAVRHAIEAHSFSAAIVPRTLLAKILQDADRLDAIGMVGVARCFYVAGRMGSGLYDPIDPEARNRPLDDKSYAIDHFETKLFGLIAGFNTNTGRAMAQDRQLRMRRFLDEFLQEL